MTCKTYKSLKPKRKILFKSDDKYSQLYDSFFNQEDNDDNDDNDEATCESKLNSISEDFCGFPWDDNPFSSHRSTFHCAKSDQLSCDQNKFKIEMICQWIADNSCVAMPSNEIDGEGVCAYFKSKE